jgi:hypothetical protein
VQAAARARLRLLREQAGLPAAQGALTASIGSGIGIGIGIVGIVTPIYFLLLLLVGSCVSGREQQQQWW